MLHTTCDRSASKNLFLIAYGTGKLCFKFGEDRSSTDVTILYTDDGRIYAQAILCSIQCCALVDDCCMFPATSGPVY